MSTATTEAMMDAVPRHRSIYFMLPALAGGLAAVGLLTADLLSAAHPDEVAPQSLSGLVAVQGTLDPAADAVVTLFRISDGELEPAGTAVTDEEGAFRFAELGPGRYRVQADLDGLSSPLSPVLELGPGSGTDDLVLLVPSPLLMLAGSCEVESGAVVVGTVRDGESGVAVPGALVSVRWIDEPGFGEASANTDQRGRFRLCNVPTGEPTLYRAVGFGRYGEWEEIRIPRPAVVFHDIDLSLGTVTPTGQDVVAELVLQQAARTMADLRGQLLDQNTGAPIVQAVVRVRGTGFQAVTDTEGRFSFPDLRPGHYTLEIQHLGYSVQTSEVEVPEGRDVTVRLRLSPRAVELEGIEVTARTRVQEVVRTSPFRRYVVSGEQLAQAERRGARIEDVLRTHMTALRVREHYTELGRHLCFETSRRVHRFESTDEQGENPTTDRSGAACEMVQVVLDGTRLGNPAWAPVSELLAGIPLADIESLEFLPPMLAGTLYGTGGSVANGVLLIHTRGRGPYRSSERDR